MALRGPEARSKTFYIKFRINYTVILRRVNRGDFGAVTIHIRRLDDHRRCWLLAFNTRIGRKTINPASKRQRSIIRECDNNRLIVIQHRINLVVHCGVVFKKQRTRC